jgi:hypothetical protein
LRVYGEEIPSFSFGPGTSGAATLTLLSRARAANGNPGKFPGLLQLEAASAGSAFFLSPKNGRKGPSHQERRRHFFPGAIFSSPEFFQRSSHLNFAFEVNRRASFQSEKAFEKVIIVNDKGQIETASVLSLKKSSRGENLHRTDSIFNGLPTRTQSPLVTKVSWAKMVRPSNKNPDSYKTTYQIIHFAHAPNSPRRRHLDQASPPSELRIIPLVRRGQPYMDEVIPMLNYAALYLDPNEVMPRDFLDRHLFVINRLAEYNVIRARFEEEARAVGLISLDFEERDPDLMLYAPYLRDGIKFKNVGVHSGGNEKPLVYLVAGTYRTTLVFALKSLQDERRTEINEALPAAFRELIRVGVGSAFLVTGSDIDNKDSQYMEVVGLHVKTEHMINSGKFRLCFEDDLCLRKPGMAKQQYMCFGSHCKPLKTEQLREYRDDRKKWCTDRNIPLNQPEFYDYIVPWWRTSKLYCWVEGSYGLRPRIATICTSTESRRFITSFAGSMSRIGSALSRLLRPWSGNCTRGATSPSSTSPDVILRPIRFCLSKEV